MPGLEAGRRIRGPWTDRMFETVLDAVDGKIRRVRGFEKESDGPLEISFFIHRLEGVMVTLWPKDEGPITIRTVGIHSKDSRWILGREKVETRVKVEKWTTREKHASYL